MRALSKSGRSVLLSARFLCCLQFLLEFCLRHAGIWLRHGAGGRGMSPGSAPGLQPRVGPGVWERLPGALYPLRPV